MTSTNWIDGGLATVERTVGQGRRFIGQTREALDNGKRMADTGRRVAYSAAGAGIVLAGIRRRSIPGFAMALVGCDMVCRGATGDSLVKLPFRNGKSARPGYGHGIKVQESMVIDQPSDRLYGFWRNPSNIAGLFNEVISIEEEGEYTHWKIRSSMGRTLEWYGEIVADRENELIGWRTVEGGAIDHAGSIRFEPVGGSGEAGAPRKRFGRRRALPQSTRMTVLLQYNPRLGATGDRVARVFGTDLARWFRKELHRFREFTETNDLGTAERLMANTRKHA
jgi:uncharacterized membrane protein